MFKKITIAFLVAMACVHAQEKDITEIDPNFRQATVGNREVRFADVRKAPFVLTGFAFRKSEDEPFYRIPTEFTKEQVNGGVLALAKHPSGGAVLFRTNSPFIALLSDPPTGADMNHMPATGVSGYDLYERLPNHKERFISIIRTTKDGSIVNVGGKAMRDYIIFLPLYSSVNKLEIGVAPDATFEPPTPQRLSRPIVFYGSSITQGGCCSRPGNNYTTMICRALDVPQVNLGFSGSARGETAMAEAIAQIDAAMFVYDYDHNAPSLEHLQKTHEPFFKIIRAARPDMPILILSRPDTANGGARRDCIKATYDNAVKAGDKNVYFFNGDHLFDPIGLNYCTVDGCHPNDLGFYRMFQNTLPIVKKALNIED